MNYEERRRHSIFSPARSTALSPIALGGSATAWCKLLKALSRRWQWQMWPRNHIAGLILSASMHHLQKSDGETDGRTDGAGDRASEIGICFEMPTERLCRARTVWISPSSRSCRSSRDSPKRAGRLDGRAVHLGWGVPPLEDTVDLWRQT